MAMHESEAFWQEFLRRPSAQRAVQLEQKIMMKETALDMNEREEQEKRQLAEALAACEPEVREVAQQLQGSTRAKRMLLRWLQESNFDKEAFSKLLGQDQPAYQNLFSLREELLEAATACEAQRQHVREQCETTVGLSTYEPLKSKTWKDLPEDELAERLCKGEICPRDEWIPGLSKDKRPLDSKSLEQHLQLGEVMMSDGRKAYAEESYDTALMRFTQGVQLLNWVRAANSEEQHLIDDMYLIFLRNQAQAALKLEKYQECLRACTTILQNIDEHDAKARYRRARAYTLLGLIKSAKDDYIFMIKSPFMEPGPVAAAQAALADLRKIVNKSDVQTRRTMLKSVNVFSENRVTGADGHASIAPTDGNGEDGRNYFFEGRGRLEARAFSEELDGPSDESVKPLANEAVDRQGAQRYHGRNLTGRHRARWIPDNEDAVTQRKEPDDNEAPTKTCEQCPPLTKDAGPPPLDLDQTKLLLVDLLEVYTAPGNQKQLHQMARDADFEVRRFLVRARKLLPQLQEEVFDRHQVPGAIHRARMRAMERSVAFWRAEDEEVEMLRQECWAAIFGDVLDID